MIAGMARPDSHAARDPAGPDHVGRLRAAGSVFAEDEAALLEGTAAGPDLERMVAARVQGAPLAHVLGWAEVCGVRVRVDPGVFVPRPRTERLIEKAIDVTPAGSVVVDLCCGSGVVAAVLAARVPGLRIHATDIDPAAVACARSNLPGQHVHEGDLLDPLPDALRGTVDTITLNAPYVPTDDLRLLPREFRDHEPRHALDGGPDGLDLHRRVATVATGWLRPGGHLLTETSRRQADAAVTALTDGGLTVSLDTEDEATVVIGRRA